MVYKRMLDLMAEIMQRDVDVTLALADDDDGDATAMDAAKLVIAVEEAFDVKIPDECVAQWRTLRDACVYVQALVDAGETGKTMRTDGERAGWYYE